jgi:hypothetical protein
VLVKSRVPAVFVEFTKPNVSLEGYEKVYINPFLVQSVSRVGQPDQPPQVGIAYVGGGYTVLGTLDEVIAKLRAADE